MGSHFSSLAIAGKKALPGRGGGADRDGVGPGDLPLAEQPLNLGLCRETREWEVKSQDLGLGELGSNPNCAVQVPGQGR